MKQTINMKLFLTLLTITLTLFIDSTSAAQQLDFYQRAAKLGHSIEDLKAGKTVSSVITIESIDQLRELLDHGLTPEQRAEEEELLFRNITFPSRVKPMCIYRKITLYLYGNYELTKRDRQTISRMFPIEVYTESAQNKTYSAPTNLGTSQAHIMLNYGTVTINDGAYIYVENSPLTYTMDNLIRNGNPPTGFGDFNILGQTGATGAIGSSGSTGSTGSTGQGAGAFSEEVAYWPPWPCACSASSTVGGVGGTGGKGGIGATGANGKPNREASITITTSITANEIIISTSSGNGGTGGTGGVGGVGGQGGRGGNGTILGCGSSSTCNSSNGGTGGQGGTGGAGGQGGNAVDSNGNILVRAPLQYINKKDFLNKLTSVVQPGQGGPGGSGGQGGPGGAAGTGGSNTASNGNSGAIGSQGATGSAGTQTGSPAEISFQPY